MRKRHTVPHKLAVAAIAAGLVASPAAFASLATSWTTGPTQTSGQARATSRESRSLSGSNTGHDKLLQSAGPVHSRAQGWVSGKTLQEAESGNFQALHQHGYTGGPQTNSAYNPDSNAGA